MYYSTTNFFFRFFNPPIWNRGKQSKNTHSARPKDYYGVITLKMCSFLDEAFVQVSRTFSSCMCAPVQVVTSLGVLPQVKYDLLQNRIHCQLNKRMENALVTAEQITWTWIASGYWQQKLFIHLSRAVENSGLALLLTTKISLLILHRKTLIVVFIPLKSMSNTWLKSILDTVDKWCRLPDSASCINSLYGLTLLCFSWSFWALSFIAKILPHASVIVNTLLC